MNDLKKSPMVSIIIPTHNRPDMLKRAIESIACQTFRLFSIRVIQNGSSHESQKIVQEFQSKGLPIFYHYERKANPSLARNMGIKNSQEKYIAFLEDDDRWMPQKLEKQIAAFDAASISNVGMVTCRSFMVDINGRTLGLRPPEYKAIDLQTMITEEPVSLIASLSGVLIKRECFERLGFFDPAYLVSGDVDFYLRLARRYQITALEEPLFYYTWHGRNLSANGVEGRLNMIKIFKKLCEDKELQDYKELIKQGIKSYEVDLFRMAESAINKKEWWRALKGFISVIVGDPLIGAKIPQLNRKSLGGRMCEPYRLLFLSASIAVKELFMTAVKPYSFLNKKDTISKKQSI